MLALGEVFERLKNAKDEGEAKVISLIQESFNRQEVL